MKFEYLDTIIESGVLTLKLNRPEVLNALNTKLKVELKEAFTEAEENPDVKCIVITGEGDRAFCAGQDLNESKNVDEHKAKEWVEEFEVLYREIKKVSKPIIASINGAAAGSGLQLALLADIRIASKNARFGMTEIDVGLPCIIGTTMFWEVMGKAKTIELILTGKILNATEALDYNLVTRLEDNIEDLNAATRELALSLANKPPVALSTNKTWFNILSKQNFDACMKYAKQAHEISYSAGEPQAMMKSFLEKKK